MKRCSYISALLFCLATQWNGGIALSDTVVDNGTYFDSSRPFHGSHLYSDGTVIYQDYNTDASGVYRGTVTYDSESAFAKGGPGTVFTHYTFSVGMWNDLPAWDNVTVTDKFKIYVSNDNITFTPVNPIVTDNGIAPSYYHLYDLDTGAISARFVRLTITARTPGVNGATGPDSWTLYLSQAKGMTQLPGNAVSDNAQTTQFGTTYSGVTANTSGLHGSSAGYVIYDATSAPFHGTPTGNFNSLVFTGSVPSGTNFSDAFQVSVSSDKVTWEPIGVLFASQAPDSTGNNVAGAATGPISSPYVRVSVGNNATITHLTFTTRPTPSQWDPCIDYSHAAGYDAIYTDATTTAIFDKGFHQNYGSNPTGSLVYDAEWIGGTGAKFSGVQILGTLWSDTFSYNLSYGDLLKAFVSNDNVTYTQVPLVFGTMLQYGSGYLPNTGSSTTVLGGRYVKITNTTFQSIYGTTSWGVALNSVLLNLGTSVSGNLALDGVNDLSAVSPGVPVGSITFDFRSHGSTSAQFTRTSTLATTAGSANGVYTLTDVPYGTYDIAISSSKQLRKVLPSVVVSPVTTVPDVTLLGGNADGNNVVDFDDFLVLLNAFGATIADPLSGYDPTADFTYDGTVNFDDFLVLLNNFGTQADM